MEKTGNASQSIYIQTESNAKVDASDSKSATTPKANIGSKTLKEQIFEVSKNQIFASKNLESFAKTVAAKVVVFSALFFGVDLSSPYKRFDQDNGSLTNDIQRHCGANCLREFDPSKLTGEMAARYVYNEVGKAVKKHDGYALNKLINDKRLKNASPEFKKKLTEFSARLHQYQENPKSEGQQSITKQEQQAITKREQQAIDVLGDPGASLKSKKAAVEKIQNSLTGSIRQLALGSNNGINHISSLVEQACGGLIGSLQKPNEGQRLSEEQKEGNEAIAQLVESLGNHLSSEVEKSFAHCQPNEVLNFARGLRQAVDPLKQFAKKHEGSTKDVMDAAKALGSGLDDVKKTIGKSTWEHFDAVSVQVVEETANYPLDGNDSVEEPTSVVFNNYGLIPDEGSVKKGDGENTLFSVDGKEYTGGPHVKYDEGQGMLFGTSGSIENHDQCHCLTVQSGVKLMILTDGCGQSKGATNAAQFIITKLNEKAEELFESVKTSQDLARAQVGFVKFAQEEMLKNRSEIEGDSTFVFAACKGNVCNIVSVGDAKAFKFSPKEDGSVKCMDLTKDPRGLADPTDSGGRFFGGTTEYSPELDGIRSVSILMDEGDILILSSDGVADCFDPAVLDDGSADIETNMSNLLEGCTNADEMLDRIKDDLQAKTFDQHIHLLTQAGRLPPHQPGQGKVDNANMTTFTYKTS